MSVFVKFVRITGHSGVFGNDIADQEARDAAQNIMRGKISASEVFTGSIARSANLPVFSLLRGRF